MNISGLILISEKELFQQIASISNNIKIDVYAVGGFVRDKLLQKQTKDIDFVCIGNGIAFAQLLQQTFYPNNQLHVFKNFGTAQLILPNFIIEFVGARKESYNKQSRNPEVEEGTFEDDLERRDFTINTLAIKIEGDNFGFIIDSFSGILDIEKKIIQTPTDPNKTFYDDPLRILRAVRFASQLNFIISDATLLSMQQNVRRLNIVAKERIAEELNKIMLCHTPSIGFFILNRIQALQQLLPELFALQGVACIDGIKHKDNFYHSLQVLDNIATTSNNVWLRWAALLHDIGKTISKRYEANLGWTFHGHEIISAKMIPKIFNRLGLPLHESMLYVSKIISLHHRPISLTSENITDSAIRRLLFEAGDDIDDLMLLCEADITSKNPIKVKQYLANFNLVRDKMIVVEAKDNIRNWQAPISGDVIMQTFNLSPCKQVGIIKEAIKEAIFEGHIKNNYNEAMIFMKAFVGNIGN